MSADFGTFDDATKNNHINCHFDDTKNKRGWLTENMAPER